MTIQQMKMYYVVYGDSLGAVITLDDVISMCRLCCRGGLTRVIQSHEIM